MKISKKILANKVRKLEVQNYDMRQKIKKMDELLTYLDELTTELNHALPDPEYDAKCEAQEADIDASLDRHRERLGLDKSELKGSELCKAMLARGDKWVVCRLADTSDEDALNNGRPILVTKFDGDFYHKEADQYWRCAVPINNQGEPLTASEVGL